jgi:hypothetical protein
MNTNPTPQQSPGEMARLAYQAVIDGSRWAPMIAAEAHEAYRDTLPPAAQARADAEYARMGLAGHTQGRRAA